MNKYLPVILFVICIGIALILAVSVPTLWPASLAIAIAGAALATALRALNSAETAYLIDDIAALQDANAELRTEIATTHSIIDELADVVEQIASVSVDSGGDSRDQWDVLRTEIADLRETRATPATDTSLLTRLTALEAEVAAQKTAVENTAAQAATASAMMLSDQAEAEPAAELAPASAPEAGNLRSLIAKAKGQIAESKAESKSAAASAPPPSTNEAAQTPPPSASLPAVKTSLTPVFEPALGAPVAFILTPVGDETPDAMPAILRHAAQIATELEQGGRDVRLFLRLSSLTLAHMTVRRDILVAIEETPALQRRLTMLTPQDGFDITAQQCLSAFAEQGCPFALENVRDWSIDLAALAKAGLGYIAVDGIAMAQSAQQQGGDPRRLAQALSAHGINLIAGGVFIREDIDTVRALEPVLVMGDGLGIPRILEPEA